MKWTAFLFGISIIAVPTSAAADLGLVRILVFDGIGGRISDADITITRERNTIKVKSDSPMSIPYGDYRALAIVRGLAPTEMAIRIDQPRQVVIIGMHLDGVEAPPPICSVRGFVAGSKNISHLRIAAVFGTYVIDIGPSETGEYALQNIECGDYFVMAFGPNGCVGAQRVRLMDRTLRKDLKFDEPAGANGCPIVKQ